MPSLLARALAPFALALIVAGPAAAQTTGEAPAEETPASETPAAEAPASETPAAQAPAEAPSGDAAAASASPANPQAGAPRIETVRTDGAWQTACVTAQETGPCLMRQVGRTEAGQEVMEVTVRRIAPQQTQQGTVEAIISVRTPIGVLLREGLTIQIDGSQPQRGTYVYCAQDGCLLQEPLPNALVSAMKKGAVAKMSFVIPQNNQPVRVEANISLTGFTAAFNGLQPG
ncbi:MAG: invasion associated locus B family protein [Pseudomonadota bacterium]